jgi:DDE superfamily endonuclease
MNNNDIELISEGIAILILATILKSLKLLTTLELQFEQMNKKACRGLLLYVTGLIGLESSATSCSIARKLGNVSHDRLTRILQGEAVIIGQLPMTLLNFCLSQTTGGWLIIDDCLIEKPYAKAIIGTYKEYEHCTKQRVNGMRFVVLLWTNGVWRIPVAWSIWHKEDKPKIGTTPSGRPRYQKTGRCLLKIDGQPLPYRTKNQIALSLLNQVLNLGLKPDYLTFDNWYAGRENLKQFHWLYLRFFSRLKENRQVFYQNEKISVSELAQRFPITSFDHKHGAYIKALEVYLPGFGSIKLLLVRDDHHEEQGASKYIFTNDLTASAPKILLSYRSRWAVETAFRDLKQNLHLEDCQARSLQSQESHMALCFLAFVLLELQRKLTFMDTHACTIGEKQELLASLTTIHVNGQRLVLEHNRTQTIPVSLQSCGLSVVNDCVFSASKILDL